MNMLFSRFTAVNENQTAVVKSAQTESVLAMNYTCEWWQWVPHSQTRNSNTPLTTDYQSEETCHDTVIIPTANTLSCWSISNIVTQWWPSYLSQELLWSLYLD